MREGRRMMTGRRPCRIASAGRPEWGRTPRAETIGTMNRQAYQGLWQPPQAMSRGREDGVAR